MPRGEAAYAGYAADGSARYVGVCCVTELTELASHVYWWWEADKRVESGTKLWRYMDLAKFLDLLESRTLFFARADKLGDPFEGASGISERKGEWDRFYLDHFRTVVRHPPEGHTALSDEEVEEHAQRLLRSISAMAENDRRTNFVSCWHANTGESEAVWRLYCPPGVPGVAIETTSDRLFGSFTSTCRVKLGQVQYVDFRRSFAGVHDRIFCKRKSLSHEAEVRAVTTAHLNDERIGLLVAVDVEALSVSVIPSPFAPPWFEELVRSLVRRYALELPVRRSELLAQPFF